ncbi:hypothetical protein [Streptomyces sp. NPDC059786]|uniref:hypothetical protein n=1 Tax=Streptomyces sp. NPDC059786 TaxID=3346946 RepID=UPI00365C1CA3
MATAAIRAKMAARGITEEPPYGCSWCGDERHHHGSQWAPIIGLHQWVEPDQKLILARMTSRRADRFAAEPPKYHATTGWAVDDTGESADEYCADCKTDGCPRYWRIQDRLDRQEAARRAALPRVGWDEEPW